MRISLLVLLLAACVAGFACWSVDTPPSGSTRVPVEETARVVDEVTEQDTLPSGFSHLREVAPSIIQEIRYTTSYNFVGEPIDGYEAPECILTTRAANALADVQEELEADGYSLKVYDCYRPQTAVNHFVRWARNDSQTIKRAFYPEEPKGLLFSRGYIARRSGHSRGSTVDLTMVRLPYVEPEPYPDPNEGPLPRCDRPLGERYAEGDLDMGTAYDCLSLLSATESRAVNAEARENRYRLRSVMSRHGFRNYSKEWWHYTLRNEPYEETYFDFPVR